MPCTARARGTSVGDKYPFNDVIDNDPCGRQIVTQVKGADGVNVDTSALSLCLWHLMLKRGARDVNPPYVTAA